MRCRYGRVLVDTPRIERDEMEAGADDVAELGAPATEEGETACAGATGVEEEIY